MESGGKLSGWDYGVLAVFSAVLFGYACFGGRVLTQHEARLPQASIEMAQAGEWLVPTCGGRPWLERPPLPHWMTIGVASVFNVWDQVWVFRIPSALAGVACVLMTGWLAARLFGREIGVLSGLMLATSFEFVHYSWLAEEDIYLAAAVLVGMVLFVKMEFSPTPAMMIESRSFFGNRTKQVWMFFFILGLTNLVKGLLFAAVMVGLAGGSYLLLSGEPKRVLRYVWLWGTIVFGIAAAWWVVAVSVRHPEMLSIWSGDLKNRTEGTWSRTPFWMYGETLLWALLPWTPAAVAGLWVTYKKAKEVPGSAERWLWCWSIVPIVFLSIPSHKHHHYLVPCLAPWGILSALGGRAIWQSVPTWPKLLRQPLVSAVLVGIPAVIGLVMFREKIPGPMWIPMVMGGAIPAGILIFGYGLLERNGRRALGMILGVALVGYCGAHSYHGVYVDRYRTEAEFVESASKLVPESEPIYVNAEGAILNTFRNLFYLGGRGETLHNLTFLLDEKITRKEVYLIGKAGVRKELEKYGRAEEVAGCDYVPKLKENQWVLYRVELDAGLTRYANDVKIDALEAMERVKGPYLGRVALGEEGRVIR